MNWEAHELARASASLDYGRHVWLINPPDFLCIERLVVLD